MASMGLIFMDERPNESKDKANNNFENVISLYIRLKL